jgi:bacillithiol system protein YtxJ
MEFHPLNNISQLDDIDLKSKSRPQVIYKHSTRCHISHRTFKVLTEEMAGQYDSQKFDIYYLDILKHRAISNEIEKRYNVEHESPQILVIVNGACVYHASHDEVNLKDCPIN